jgi:hypothetical protein
VYASILPTELLKYNLQIRFTVLFILDAFTAHKTSFFISYTSLIGME